MNRPAPDYLDQITAVAERWVRRCNGQPAVGIPVSARGLRIVLAGSSDISAEESGVISWTSSARRFTAEPILDAAA